MEKMSKENRAKQFMPFNALRGYYDLIKEKQRIKTDKKELSQDKADMLSYKMNNLQKGMMVKIVYYNIDHYDTIEGLVSKIDSTYKTITIVKTKINIDDIYDIL